MVDLLSHYQKHEKPEVSAILLLNKARSGARNGESRRTRSGIQNVRERGRVLTSDELNDLVRCYVAGHSTYDLAHAYGIRRDTVSAHLRRQGVLRRVNVAVVLDDDDRRRVVVLYEGGSSMRRIRELLGFSERSILRALVSAGVARRPSASASSAANQTA